MPVYYGVNNKAKLVSSGYYGVNGNAQVIYKTGIVPNDYIPVEYIFNDHNNANGINTGIIPSTYTRIVCKMAFGPKFNPIYTSDIISDGNHQMEIVGRANSIRIYVGARNVVKDNITTSSPFEIDLNRSANKDSYFNNELIFNNTSSYNSSFPTELFYGNDICDVRIYSCAIYQSMLNGILSKNYIPCIRKSDGRVGMWESIARTFCSGSNTSTRYSSGPVITP